MLMSLLSESVLARGNCCLHTGPGLGPGQRPSSRANGKSNSHTGFLAPLVQLVRDPVGTLSSTVGRDGVSGKEVAASQASRKPVLYLRLKDAESYDEWKAAATELDGLEGNESWKLEDESQYYDAALVAGRLKELDEAGMSCDVRRMLFLIRTTLTRNLGDMGDLQLYKHSHVGTKKLIERYIESAQRTMAALLDVSAKQGANCPIEPRRLVEQLLQTRQSFGRSALLLSGGGTFGMNHIGVVQSLWEARLLPRIVSGASAGSIVSAVLCTKTDDEIPQVLAQFCDVDLNVFGEPGKSETVIHKAVRMLTAGVLFDISHLMRVMRGLLGDITFQEAYNRTRRILNIPVSTSSLYELPRLLNYITAPNVMIWSAVCTSCSVPLVYKKASLRAKDPTTGLEVLWDPNPDATWIDGSVDNDLPMTRLAEMFNVNHFIVSQVNPHVVPFLEKDANVVDTESQQTTAPSNGSAWRATTASLAKGELLHRLQGLVELGILPNVVTKAKSILSQRYSGDITILPKISYTHFPRVLSNPTPEYMKGCMLEGQRATWPKLSRIQNHVAIELALDNTIQKLRTRLVFTPSQVNLRHHSLSRPLSQGVDLSPQHRTKSVNKITHFKPNSEPSSPVLQKSSSINPLLLRASKKPTSQPIHSSARQQHQANASKPRSSGVQPADLMSLDKPSPTNDTPDQDRVSDPDSETIAISSSPPPLGPTLWPMVPQSPCAPASQPSAAADSWHHNREWHSGTLLNLTMTSASSPESRYTHFLHPPAPMTLEPSQNFIAESKLISRPNSRSESVQTRGPGLVIDHSGTRGMLMRKRSFKKMTPDGLLE